MIQHVWFDMGGTLYKETPAFDIVHDALRYKEYSKIVGENNLDKVKREYDKLYAQYGSNSGVFSSLGKPSDFWQNAFENINLAEVLIPDPTVAQTLEKLAAKIPISLFTNFKAGKIKATLELLGINKSIFAHVLNGDDVQKRKPATEGFEKMIELSGLSGNEILYVGDRLDVDIEPAKSVGIQTCLMWAESTDSDYCALQFADLLKIVQAEIV